MEEIVKIPKVLIPRKGIDMNKWATIACDQFCAKPKYWEELTALVGDAPSTLKLTCPEIYLNEGNLEERIAGVNANMKSYLENGLFDEYEDFILVEREVGGAKRVGVMVAIDLECYNWNRVRVPIRATEGTIIERLPVRIKIRKNAPIELPHALLLIDNPERDIIEPLYARHEELTKLYDFDLNMGGGHIRGYRVDDSQAVLDKFNALLEPQKQIAKYGVDAGIMFAVGDGNHSVAAAKVMWDELKEGLTEDERIGHPARYMLVEVVNLYGGGMDFEPIHRLIYEKDEEFISGLKNALSGEGKLKLIYKDKEENVACPQKASMCISAVQGYIENYLKAHKDFKVEYVHNEGDLREAVEESDGLGIVMPSFPNSELVNFVVNVGNLPKKAFSIGEPEHKRYYLECKLIKK